MCFTGSWLLGIVIWAIIVGGCYAIIRVVLPLVLAQLGPMGPIGSAIVAILRIVLWVILLIFLVYFAYDMIMCLVQHMPALPSARGR